MTSDRAERPSRAHLQQRLRGFKRAVVILAAGSFAGIAMLAAGGTTSRGQTSNPATHSRSQVDQQEQSGSFWSTPDDGSGSSGSLGSGSNAGPPAAGTHAS